MGARKRTEQHEPGKQKAATPSSGPAASPPALKYRGGELLQRAFSTGSLAVCKHHSRRRSIIKAPALIKWHQILRDRDVSGVDMIKWNDEGKIVEFKVMIRPLKAINLIHRKMGEMLKTRQ